MSSRSKRQTIAKITRERLVKERRERKLEKKQAAAAARKAGLLEDGRPEAFESEIELGIGDREREPGPPDSA
jgi:hypothetical protein